MAIINSVAFGKARKTAGNIVFYDRLGQTVARQKNLTPTNPNTYAQVAQRIRITNPSRVYRSIVDATAGIFGAKFFDYSFGRSYLATKRRTAYNEFFYRSMLAQYPAFLDKSEVQNRTFGIPVPCEVAQGSMTPVQLVGALDVFDGKMEFVTTGSAALEAIQSVLTKWLAMYGWQAISDFKCVVMVQSYVGNSDGTFSIRTDAGLITSDGAGSATFDTMGSAIVLTPGAGKTAVTVPGVIVPELGGFTMGFCLVPFATINGVATSANTSFAPRLTEDGLALYENHTSDAESKNIAIMSYSPSTPGL